MKEIVGDIWDYHKQGHWIVITTNGNVKANGEAVMGKGVALQAKQRFPDLPKELGRKLQTTAGNVTHFFLEQGIITLPTKHNWWDKADLALIERGIGSLAYLVKQEWMLGGIPEPLYMVRPGCSSGGLDWKDVKPILEKYLDDRFIVVEKRQKDEQSNI